MGKGWDKANETADRISAQGKVFIRLENDEDKIVGAFLGDPHVEEVIWNEKLKQNEPFTKEHEAAGKKPSAKFFLNFYATAEGNGSKTTPIDPPTVRVFNCSLKTFKGVQKARDKYGLENKFFEIERKGKKGDTQTTYTVLPEGDISSELKSSLAKAVAAHEAFIEKGTKVPEGVLVLHDLVKIASGEDETEDASKKNGASKSDAISTEDSQALVRRLKNIPRAMTDKFLARFGLATVKELKLKDLDTAKEFVSSLEKEAAPPPAQNSEIDPFA
jgi:hypothetical protein